MRIKLKDFDLFGYPIKLYHNGKQNKTSLYGGIVSLIIVIGSLTLLGY